MCIKRDIYDWKVVGRGGSPNRTGRVGCKLETGRLGDPALPKPNIFGDYEQSSITPICVFTLSRHIGSPRAFFANVSQSGGGEPMRSTRLVWRGGRLVDRTAGASPNPRILEKQN